MQPNIFQDENIQFSGKLLSDIYFRILSICGVSRDVGDSPLRLYQMERVVTCIAPPPNESRDSPPIEDHLFDEMQVSFRCVIYQLRNNAAEQQGRDVKGIWTLASIKASRC